MLKKHDEVVVKIVEVGKEALCKGITEEGLEVFTRYAIVGEKVKVKIFKTDPLYGDVIEVIEPSPFRITPECKYFGECGGCDLQMLPYEKQLEFKKSLLVKEFSTIPDFDISVIEDVIPSPRQFYYRNSVMFRVNPKKKKIGFLKRDTNIVIDIDECKIASEGINYALRKVKNQENFPQHVFKVRTTLDGDVVVNLIETDEFQDRPVIETITLDGTTYRFRISRESFFQVNSFAIPIWLKQIRRLIENSEYDRSLCLDLYCGSGIISFFVRDLFEKVIGIEVSKTSVEDGIYNISTNNIDNVEIILGDVGNTLPQVKIPDIIIIDPSRVGIEEKVINIINQNLTKEGKPKKIIYSSCNYETQVRDIKLFHKAGFKVSKVIPIDMFPQTHHIEVIALLET